LNPVHQLNLGDINRFYWVKKIYLERITDIAIKNNSTTKFHEPSFSIQIKGSKAKEEIEKTYTKE